MLPQRAMALRALLLLLVAGAFCGVSVAGEDDAPRISVAGEDDVDTLGQEGHPGGDAMQQLLNWAIKNSDPERLKELMQKYQERNLTIKDVYGQDMIDALFVDEGSVLKDMSMQIGDFANASVTDENLEDALDRLIQLVEQVDNAGNLHRNGGLRPLLELGVSGPLVGLPSEGVRRSESVRALALWTLGVAVQNNEPVQADLTAIGGLPPLLGRLPLCVDGSVAKAEDLAGSEYCAKLLFAISSLVKNNQTIQADADSQGLFDWLLDVGIAHSTPVIAKKSMGLLDIALSQSPDLPVLSRLSSKQNAVATSLLSHIHGKHSDLDMDAAEKALRLVNRLLSLRPMLFEPSFQSQLTQAVTSATDACERVHGAGDELCVGLKALAEHSNLALAARDLSDDEL